MAKLIFLTLLLSAFSANAIDINKFKEHKCDEVNPDVDPEWMASVPKWYIPLWSKLDLIYSASGMLNKSVSELKESDLGNGKACPIFGLDGTLSAFGIRSKYDVQPFSKGFQWTFEGQTGVSKFQLTDNKSFILIINCWTNFDDTTWAVMTPEPKIKKTLKTKILNHIQSLGFNPKFAHAEDFSNCKN